ncbi:LCP family protein [Cytobacillus spongiae]|uniref:LCP family protein n=1 Tax=Cytobacillus spongiae TaxID=2901381 RepID=UPI001F21FA07|nr:LCP family protein [Cytobacillus spongiae]UII55631.1 LCP family protein [Cytobacillus spongiae]
MAKNRNAYKRQIKKARRKRIVAWILLPILVLTISATVYGAFLYSKAESVMDESYTPIERDTKRTEVDPKVDNISILMIGVDDSDTRAEVNSRSDALMVATFNKKAKSVKLLSIPRDSLVYIPSEDIEDKINHAHAFGGPASTIETVEELLEIPIDYYVKVNFNAFIDIVDALDGIKVEVPYAINEFDSKDNRNAISLQPGLQVLDGEEALALARTRHQDNDIMRGERQQEILKAIVDKAISANSITKYADVIDAIGENMQTDLSFSQMKSFFDYATAGSSLQIDSIKIDGEDLWIDNGNNRSYYYQLDEESISEVQLTLQVHLGIEEEELDRSSLEDSENTNSSNY